MRSGEASHWKQGIVLPRLTARDLVLASGTTWVIGDRLVGRPAHPPAESDLLRLARSKLEIPGHHAARRACIALTRRRGGGEHLDLDVLGLAHRDLVLDHDLDRP